MDENSRGDWFAKSLITEVFPVVLSGMSTLTGSGSWLSGTVWEGFQTSVDQSTIWHQMHTSGSWVKYQFWLKQHYIRVPWRKNSPALCLSEEQPVRKPIKRPSITPFDIHNATLWPFISFASILEYETPRIHHRPKDPISSSSDFVDIFVEFPTQLSLHHIHSNITAFNFHHILHNIS